jgi:L-threonylcarbamoyladenylate synthase
MSCTIRPADEETLADTVAALKRGKVIGVPTETVYGLVADAASPAAIRALKTIKGREEKKPLQVMVPEGFDLGRIAVLTPPAKALIRAFMPGALTLVLPQKESPLVHPDMAPGQQTIGIRMPDHPTMKRLLEAFGKPLVASSANKAGEESTFTAQAAAKAVGASIGWVIDGGTSALGRGSTVCDMCGASPKILREGSITYQEIKDVLSR